VALGRAGDAVRIWGHVMPAFGPASRRNLAPIGAAIAILVLCLTIASALRSSAIAHEDDGGGPAFGAATKPWPRLTAQSELYELVAILKGERLTIYLDDFATNEPVVDAAITIAIGEADPVIAQPGGDGTYAFSSPRLGGDGTANITFSIKAATGDDRLTGTLKLPERRTLGPVSSSTSSMRRWTEWMLAPIQNPASQSLLSLVLGILAGYFFRSGRLVPAAATAAAAAGVFVLLVGTALSRNEQGRENEAAPASAVISDGPRRLSDGGVFLAKPTQRLLEVRTVAVKQETARRAVSLIGRVIADPNRTGLVQSIGGGRLIAPAGGLPHIGQRVTKGQVLAEIERALPQADRTTISEKIGEIGQLIAVTEAKLKRLRQLAERGVALQSLVVEAELELEGLRRRLDAIRETRTEPEVLRAPTNGLIAAAKVVPGQVVHAQDIMFQIVDPDGLWVEALVYGAVDPASLGDATTLGSDGQPIHLLYQGFSRTLQQQAALVHFAIPNPPAQLNVGQPVTVLAHTGTATSEIVLPREAVVRSGSGETIVWLHDEFEDFDPKPVRTRPLDATRVIVAAGVNEGERIVIRGAQLVNQIR